MTAADTSLPHLALLALFLMAISLSGCTVVGIIRNPGEPSGMIYSHFRQPLTHDLKHTPVVSSSVSGGIIHVEEPVSGYGIRAEFASNAIGEIARRHGLERVLWADFEYFSLLGIWEEKIVHVYGTRPLSEPRGAVRVPKE
ncbi:MAG: hypothetical protein D6820_08260 [Lentisphaerae bacterium]|nr:MAG: hypothetical protein D6820_08260 [Lentisphaerota bacterium]